MQGWQSHGYLQQSRSGQGNNETHKKGGGERHKQAQERQLDDSWRSEGTTKQKAEALGADWTGGGGNTHAHRQDTIRMLITV